MNTSLVILVAFAIPAIVRIEGADPDPAESTESIETPEASPADASVACAAARR